MHELLPIISGLVTGLLLGLVRPRTRLPLGVGAAVALGVLATVVSGEFRISWAFLLVDIPLVGMSSAAALVLGKRVRGVPIRPGGGPLSP